MDGWICGQAEEQVTVTSSGFPLGKAENNSDRAVPLAKLFGPIEIEANWSSRRPEVSS
jgi:hypothetical protein